jgi:hypothetical protein
VVLRIVARSRSENYFRVVQGGARLPAVENAIRVDVYTRAGCVRTEQAKRMLSDAHQKFPLQIRMHDVTHDIALEIAYGKDTPVVLVEGTERFRRQINEHELKIILQTITMRKMQERRRQKDESAGSGKGLGGGTLDRT